MTDVPLREYIEAIVAEHNRRRDDLRVEDHRRIADAVAALREAFNASVAAVNDARALQADEYERRLEDLNHAHAEAQRVLNTYVPQSVYAKDMDLVHKLEKRVDVSEAERGGRSKIWDAIRDVATSVALIISVGLAILIYARS